MLCLYPLFMKKINRRNGTCNFQVQQSELWYASFSQPMRFARSRFPVSRFLVGSLRCLYFSRLVRVREVVKATILEQGPPYQKIDGGLCLHLPLPPSSTLKDGVFITYPPLYPAVKNDNEIQTLLFLFIWQW